MKIVKMMMKSVKTIVSSVIIIANVNIAYAKKYEREYQKELCSSLNGVSEYVLPDKTRVDCLTKDLAIEIDFARKWAECVGQALYYGHETNRVPTCALIASDKDIKYIKRIKKMVKKYSIKLILIDKNS